MADGEGKRNSHCEKEFFHFWKFSGRQTKALPPETKGLTEPS
jgi:hypothetical protein